MVGIVQENLHLVILYVKMDLLEELKSVMMTIQTPGMDARTYVLLKMVGTVIQINLHFVLQSVLMD